MHFMRVMRNFDTLTQLKTFFQYLTHRGLETPYGDKDVGHCSDAWLVAWQLAAPGPRLNIKTVLSTYGDFHVKDKTADRTSYL